MKNLENYGVIEMSENEISTIEGGWPWDDLVDVINLCVEYFDSSVLPSMDDSTGTTLDGYMGSKI